MIEGCGVLRGRISVPNCVRCLRGLVPLLMYYRIHTTILVLYQGTDRHWNQVSAVFVIRVINRRYLVSVSGQAHLRILRVHEGTNPTAFLMRENPLPPAPLRLSDYSCVGFRGYIGVNPGFDAILILRYPPKPNAPFRA